MRENVASKHNSLEVSKSFEVEVVVRGEHVALNVQDAPELIERYVLPANFSPLRAELRVTDENLNRDFAGGDQARIEYLTDIEDQLNDLLAFNSFAYEESSALLSSRRQVITKSGLDMCAREGDEGVVVFLRELEDL